MSAWKALFAGDVYLNTRSGQPLVAEDMRRLIRAHDLASCNFEAPVTAPGAERLPKVGSWLAHAPAAARNVLDAGFDVINLANNHLCDYGDAGVAATLAAFREVTSLGAGLDFETAYELKVNEVGGVRIGLLAYGEGEFGALMDGRSARAGFAWVNHPEADHAVLEARRSVDVLLVQVHAGVEEVDLPLPEWRSRYRKLIELGADAVIGHHPHVPQGWESIDGKPVFYSLGNFLFETASPSARWNRGYVVSLEFEGAELRRHEVIPIEGTRAGVDVCRDPAYREYLDGLSRALADPRYEEQADAQAVELWRSRYRRYYRDAAIGIFADRVRSVFGGSSRRPSSGVLLLQHNLQTESHRWTVQRALAALASGRAGRG